MKAAFHTLGCKVNSYETQAVLEQFRAASFEIVDFTQPADVYVINTCSVTQTAGHKSRQMIGRARRLNPDAVIVAAGCYAQEEPDRLSGIDPDLIIIGNNHKNEIVQIVLGVLENRHSESVLSDMLRCRDFEEQRITGHEESTRAYIKIQDGCDRFCSYCIIPYLRGRSRCRNEADILEEAAGLAAHGYKELVITGIDISSYDGLGHLAQEFNRIEGLQRIRFGSFEVSMITQEFLTQIKACEKVCPHFHLSLQSGCDTVLKRMNRKYTADEYAETVDLIREFYADPGITTDIIVGFPGETDEEFGETLDFVSRIGFTQAHIFKFSARQGTRAAEMPDQIPAQVKAQRSARLIELTDALQHLYEDSLIGTEQSVLLEDLSTDSNGINYFTGYTPQYVRIAVQTEGSAGPRNNDVVPVKVEGRKPIAGEEMLFGCKKSKNLLT